MIIQVQFKVLNFNISHFSNYEIYLNLAWGGVNGCVCYLNKYLPI